MVILESIVAGLTTNFITYLSKCILNEPFNDTKLRYSLENSLKAAIENLEKEFEGITPYLGFFFNQEKHSLTIRSEAFIEAIYSDDDEIKMNFIERFRKDLSFRLKVFEDIEELPQEYSQIDFPSIRSHFKNELSNDYIAGSIAIRFIEISKKQTEKLETGQKKTLEIIKKYISEQKQRIDSISNLLDPFENLTLSFFSRRQPKPDDHWFYFGVEPRWEDINANKDFIRDIQEAIMQRIIEDPTDTFFVPLLGSPKSGKTTLMRRLAHDLVWEHNKVVLWVKEDYSGTIKADQIENIYDSIKKTIYIFNDDMVLKNPEEWGELIRRLVLLGIPSYIIGSMYPQQWDMAKAPSDRNLILAFNKGHKPFLIENTVHDLKLFIKKIEQTSITPKLSLKDALSKALIVARTEGDLFLNFIYFYTENRSFRDSILDCMDKLRRNKYHVFNALVWISMFYQFSILVQKTLLEKCFSDQTRDSLFTQPEAQKYVWETDDRKNLYIFNQLVAHWIFEYCNKEVGNGKRLEKRLEDMILKDSLNTSEWENIFTLFYFMSGKKEYQKIVKRVIENENNKKIINQAYNDLTSDFLSLAVGILYFNLKMFNEAIEVYKKAIEKDTNCNNAYNNWGVALGEFSRLTGDLGLLNQAIDKFKIATEQQEIYPEAYNNWGNTLTWLAIITENFELFREAFDKYKTATEQQQILPSVYHNWGMAMVEHAKRTGDLGLFDQAIDKFRIATEQQEIYPEAYFNLGHAISSMLEFTEDEHLQEEQIDSFITSGFQFILSRRFERLPFERALNIKTIDPFNQGLCSFILLSFDILEGKTIRDEIVVIMKRMLKSDLADLKPVEIKILVLTLLDQNNEQLYLKEDDTQMIISLKILVNSIIELRQSIDS